MQREGKSDGEREALIIVHLSDLDNYTWECGLHDGHNMAQALARAVDNYEGLLIATNQQKPLHPTYSGPREVVLQALRRRTLVVMIAHDERIDGWEKPLRQIEEKLREHAVSHVVLGGFEYRPGEPFPGCVLETKRLLEEQGFVCRVDEKLCG